MKVVVTGIGVLTALGSLVDSWQRLLRGESGIKIQQPFLELAPRPLALIGSQPSSLSALAMSVAEMAFQDAGLTPSLLDCGVVVGSSRGCQANWETLARNKTASTCTEWLGYLPHAGAIAIARKIGTTAVVLSPMAACATGIWAIARGVELIQTGECDRVIAGAVETPITPLTLAGFAKMGALATTGAYPFDKQREGLVLGEGAAVFILESAELAESRNAKIYGQILGAGFTCDAYHVSAPAILSQTALSAIQQCLKRSQLTPRDIDYIHAHGTSTTLNDANEAQLIQKLFPVNIPVSSTKGTTGHTLGASGAIGAAFCLLALKHQIVPPCVGLRESEFDLNLVKIADSHSLQATLCFSFGFGGQNAVLALAKN